MRAILAGLLFSCFSGAFQLGAQTAFLPGEKLTYSLSWSFIKVGEATLEVEETTFNNEPAYRIILTARTNSFADTFYKVRDRMESVISSDATYSLHYEKDQKEGKHEKDIIVRFDWENGTAHYTNYGEPETPVPLSEGMFDPLGIVYGVRQLALQIGERLEVPTTDGRKAILTEIDIVKKDRVKVPIGRFDSIIVEPNTKDIGGVFEKSDDATIRFWLSDDERKIPLQMRSKVVIGSFWAELTNIEGPGAERYLEK